MSDALRIIPLGGLGEVGKNMTLYELGDERILIDAGLAFPRDEHLGVDLVLPDFSYLEDRPLRAIVLTHGHEDHVGALPYVLREVEVGEVIATRLTLGLIKSKLDEHGLCASTTLREADPDAEPMQLGPFRLEFVRMAHSIPDCVAIVVETARRARAAHGRLEARPHAGRRAQDRRRQARRDRQPWCRPHARRLDERRAARHDRLRAPRRRGVPAADPDAHRAASSSPRFASNIHRMQQAADVAIASGRKVAVVGRSMRKNMNIARNLGYIDIPEDAIVSPKEAMELPPSEVLILCTGSQGEPMSALTRIAYDDHANVSVERGDTVIISAKPVPGQRAPRPRRDQPAREVGSRGPAPGDRHRPRLRPRLLGGDAHAALARAPEGADADPRRVPDARRAREARARRGDPRRRAS